MSFGIVFELSTVASKGKDIFLNDRFETNTDTQVIITNKIDKYGFVNGLNRHLRTSDKSQNDFCHHEMGTSCTARIRANGKYEPMKMIKADNILNCIFVCHLTFLRWLVIFSN